MALGPKPRSYKQRTPKKMIQLALRSALSDRAAMDRVVVIDSWGFAAPRTKDATAALKALGVEGKVLVVLGPDDQVARKSFRNLPDVHALLASELNAYDVLCSDWIVFTSDTVPTAQHEPAAEPVPEAAAVPVAAAQPEPEAQPELDLATPVSEGDDAE